MKTHKNGIAVCPGCDLKLKDAHPDLVKWFNELVKPKFPSVHISWSYRGKEDQEQAFLDGKSKLHYPNSEHNKVDADGKPCARALDLFELDFNGIARWAYGFFRDIANLSNSSDASIEWGGTFKSISDFDHYQIKSPTLDS